MFNEDKIYEEYSSDSIEDIVRERNKNRALRKIFPLTFDNGKDNTRYYLMNNYDDGSSNKELLTDDFFKNLEKKYSGSTLPESNNVNGQTPTENGFVDKIKTAARSVVESESDKSWHPKDIKAASRSAKNVPFGIDANEKGNDVSLNYMRENLRSVNDDEDYYNRNTPDAKTLDWATRNWTNAKIAYDVGFIHPKLKNISSGAQRFAKMGGILPLQRLDSNHVIDPGSRRGAFRHSLWQATIAAKHGVQKAEEIGAVHEETIDVDLNKRIFKDVNDADLVVDLLNNKIGREIGDKNKGQKLKSLAFHLLDRYYINGLYSAEKDENGYWHIYQRRIDDKTYMELNDLFEKADENGFLPTDDKSINLLDVIDFLKVNTTK